MNARDLPTLRIGTRASRLAMWQAEHVASMLSGLPGAPIVQLVTIKTTGDVILDTPLSQVPGKGFFTKEIEQALLERRIDLAVHSLKDLETSMPSGLMLGAVLERADPRDVLIGRPGTSVEGLANGALVGTSSLRRRAMLARWRPDLETRELRGNVPTRIQKFVDGEFDALILAAAGVQRLGLNEHIAEYLSHQRMYPAISQGAVAVQIREDDDAVKEWIAPLDHLETRCATTAERALLRRLEGGCQVPVGGLATVDAGTLVLSAAICSLDGFEMVEGVGSGTMDRAEAVGRDLADDLLGRGGESILERIREDQSSRVASPTDVDPQDI